MGIGGVIELSDGRRITVSKYIGWGTNNVAEYKALIEVLDQLNELGVTSAEIYGDSQLVVNQVMNAWKVKDNDMVRLWGAARSLMRKITAKGDGKVRVYWIERDFNVEANDLASVSIKEAGAKRRSRFSYNSLFGTKRR